MDVTTYGKDKKGNILVWRVFTHGDSFTMEHGRKGGSLVQQVTKCVGKNVGRANETTPEQQAEVEANAKLTSKLKQGYFLTEEEAVEYKDLSPMNLGNYDSYKDKITYPCYVQEKLDGVHIIVYEDGTAKTRQGEVVALPKHIEEDLKTLIKVIKEEGKEWYGLDCELFAEKIPLQDIISAMRVFNEETTPKLRLHIYDIPVEDKVYNDRLLLIKETDYLIMTCNISNIDVIPSFYCYNEGYIDSFFKEVTSFGGEGVVVRGAQSLYKFGTRSTEVLKRKPRLDGEALVLSTEPDKNNQGVLTCEAVNGKQQGKTFKLLMRKDSGIMNYRDYENSKGLVGKTIKYEYEALSKGSIPTKPVGIGLRGVDKQGNPML